MRQLVPGKGRLFCHRVSTFFWTLFWASVVYGCCEAIRFSREVLHHRPWQPSEYWAQAVLVGVAGLFGAIYVIILGVSYPNTRYEISPRELRVHGGGLWRGTKTIDLIDIQRVEVSSGPLMRLFGLSDLKVYGGGSLSLTTIFGVNDPEELRHFLLDRREALQESAVHGEYCVAKEPRDLVLARLANVLERIETRVSIQR